MAEVLQRVIRFQHEIEIGLMAGEAVIRCGHIAGRMTGDAVKRYVSAS